MAVEAGGRMLSELEKYFGFSGFREGQEEIVRRIAAGEELCVVMPTGAGKSLCYQLPVLMRPGYGLVISPLIALMKDQVDGLNARGLPAACVNSAQTLGEQSQAMRAVAEGRIRFLYVAPERFRAPAFAQFLAEHRPSLVVVDEAHCVSQWGHDFRPDYQRIWQTTPLLKELQVCAFTATATPAVRDDIREQLGRPHMEDVVTGFRRGNLRFSVVSCQGKDARDAYIAELLETKVPTILYSSTRKETERISGQFKIRMYHAGMSDEERRQAQEYFSTDACPVLVATNAFGMGIDRADIRRVVHVNLPGSLEAYYQEAGRAGRDGQPADCILMFSYADVHVQEFIIAMNNPPYAVLEAVHRLLVRDQRQDGSVLWMPEAVYGELSGVAESMQQVSTAARILERHGLVERSYLHVVGGMGELRFKDSLQTLMEAHASQQTQRSIFIYRLAKWLLAQGLNSFQGSLYDLASCTGFRLDQLNRLLAALSDSSVLSWTTGEVEGILTLTELGRQEKMALDREWLEKKSQLDSRRLDDLLGYCRCRGCRQVAIVNYFGEKIGRWHCGCCDHCEDLEKSGRKPTAEELKTARSILQAIQLVDGRFGRRRILNMLLGEPDASKEITEHLYYGSLQAFGKAKLEALLDALTNGGYVEVGDGEYPCLALSAPGMQALMKADSELDFRITGGFGGGSLPGKSKGKKPWGGWGKGGGGRRGGWH